MLALCAGSCDERRRIRNDVYFRLPIRPHRRDRQGAEARIANASVNGAPIEDQPEFQLDHSRMPSMMVPT